MGFHAASVPPFFVFTFPVPPMTMRNRKLGVRLWLTLLVLGTMLPLLVCAGIAFRSILAANDRERERALGDRVRALGAAVDAEIRAAKTVLLTLAEDVDVRTGRFAVFEPEARAVAARYQGWMVVNDASGQQRLNTLLPPGAPLPRTAAGAMVQAVFRDGQPVTDFTFGAAAQRYIISNSAPVLQDGRVVLCLSLNYGPERLSRLLAQQHLPETWLAAIFDGQHRFIARSQEADDRVGKPAMPEFQQALDHEAGSGVIAHTLSDGRAARSAFLRLSEAPWVLALAVPASELPSASGLVLTVLASILAAAVGVALFIGHRIARSITEIAGMAPALARGDAPTTTIKSSIAEIDRLEEALADAGSRTKADQTRLESRVADRTAALTAANLALQEEVAQREAAEAGLRAAALEWQRTFDSVPDLIALIDTAHRIVRVNRAMADQLGLPAEQCVGRRCYEVVHATSCPHPACPHAQTLCDGLSHQLEVHEPQLRGDFLVSTTPLKNETGALIGSVHVARNITAQRQAARELESAARFPQENPYPVLRIAHDGTVLYANAAARPLLAAWACDIGRPLPAEWNACIARVYDSAQSEELDLACGERLYTCTLVPVHPHGYVNLYARDVTDRIESERRYRDLFTAMGEGFALHELVYDDAGRPVDYRFLEVNPAFGRITGLDPRAVVGQTARAVLPGLEAHWILRYAQVIETGAPTRFEEYSADLVRWYEVYAFSPRPGQFATLFGDITARKEAQAALQQAHDQLDRRVQERTAELAAALAHEAAQAEQLQALTGELAVAEQRERQRLAQVLHDGIQQLLVAARLRVTLLARAGDTAVSATCQEITALLEEAVLSSRSLTAELSPPILYTGGLIAGLEWLARWMRDTHGLAVDLTADPAAAPADDATMFLLFQGVRELLFNVVKHAGVQEARVEVSRQDGQIRILVADEGTGMEPDGLQRSGSTGLGLSSIRQRLEFLGGRLEIRSAPGAGSRFSLVAPLRGAGGAKRAPAGVDGGDARSEAAGAEHRCRVLLVDDHTVVRQALAQVLQREPDLEVVGEAADGKACLELTGQLHPDVVLMDINMPVMNGIECTRVIRAEYPDVRVIGLSMFPAADQFDAMQAVGAVAYVSKSAPVEELLDTVRAWRRPAPHDQTPA